MRESEKKKKELFSACIEHIATSSDLVENRGNDDDITLHLFHDTIVEINAEQEIREGNALVGVVCQ